MADAPFEILEEIAQYLHPNDVAHSSRVCQAWLAPMRKALYRSVTFASRRRFRRFFRSIQQVNADGIPYGQHVKSLILRDNVGMTWVELEQLMVLCPGLETLYFHQRVWKYVPRRGLWRMWSRMKSLPPLMNYHALKLLPVYGSRLTSLHIVLSHATFHIFSSTPHLHELVLLPNDSVRGEVDMSNNHLAVHPTHFYSIMTHCPELKVFKILCKTVMIFQMPGDPSQILVKPHDYLETLVITYAKSSMDCQYAWINYFAQSYPALVTLNVNFITVNTVAAQQRRFRRTTVEERIQAFTSLARNCVKLEHLRLRGIDPLIAPNSTFFETLSEAGTRLKTLEMGRVQELLLPGGSAHYLRYSKETYDAMLQAAGQSLAVLHLHTAYWSLPHVSTLVATITQRCPSLNDLKISGLAFGRRLRSPIQISTILSKLSELERLEINNAHVTYGDAPIQHECKLQSFRLSRVHFTAELFTALSEWCPRLSQLSVVCSVQQQLDVATAFSVRMPNHTFDEINLTEIYLELEASRVGYAVVCSLTQLSKPKWAKREGQATRWYMDHMRRLRGKNMAKFEKYEEIRSKGLENELTNAGQLHDWMKHGRVAVECSSVRKFVFNGGAIIP
ncbi:hypothetical protein BJV82DRAFT_606990 [Fennellomyces sp. T-0311]|nr:hypothetical protein BJV82DRAFT_606990 [Fennellomyces sp. T-0311]